MIILGDKKPKNLNKIHAMHQNQVDLTLTCCCNFVRFYIDLWTKSRIFDGEIFHT